MNRNQVQSNLECPVCLTVIKGSPVYVCKNIHSLCGLCFEDLPLPKICPSGRCAFETPPGRNHEKEKMIGEFKFSLTCFNARSGCGVTLEEEELQEHKDECRYRTVPCPYSICTSKIKAIELWNHICSEHEPMLRPNSRLSIVISNTDLQAVDTNWKLNYMVKEEERFFLQFVKRDNVFLAWVKIQGSRRKAAKWKFSIEAGEEEKVTYMHGAVYSEDMSLEEIMEAGAYLSLGNHQVRRIMGGRREEDDKSVLGRLRMKFIVTRK